MPEHIRIEHALRRHAHGHDRSPAIGIAALRRRPAGPFTGTVGGLLERTAAPGAASVSPRSAQVASAQWQCSYILTRVTRPYAT